MDTITDTQMKIGLFGGTFNPVHMGHVRVAEEIREKYALSKIVFIPAFLPPHKKAPCIPAEHRYAMVQLAIADNPLFDVSDVELARRGSSYSIDTISCFNDVYKNSAELFFIMGIDAFKEIHTWKEYPLFFQSCHFIVMNRPGHGEQGADECIPQDIAGDFTPAGEEGLYRHTSGSTVGFCTITLLDISSTDIRNRIHEGKSIKYLVHHAVEAYIKEQGLYL